MTSANTLLTLDRRRLIGGAAGLGGVLSLAACGVRGGNNADEPTPSADDAATGAERTVDADNGRITVPTQPERVVVTDNYSVWMLFDVGLVPVGIPEGTAAPATLPADIHEAIRDVTTIGVPGEPNAQAVAAVEPDLILDQFYPAKVEELTPIAPVVHFNWHDSDSLWHQQAERVADAVNRSERLTEVRDAYLSRLAEVRETYAEQIAASTWAPLSGGPNGTFFLGSPLLSVMRDLGLTIGAGIPDDEAGFVEMSYEDLDVLEDCTVLIYSQLFDGELAAPTAELMENRVWQGLTPVAAGRAFPVHHYGVRSYRYANGAVDEIEAILAQL
ncbi:ABC transporter substrate-binding protein [Streptomyces sp. NBRC 109706]|uniref:ABC transporter substrate-binding protein n=1 Tax=Streptomyces sp. NBRC 109706 TaxID=1550035 RepID=UPI000A3DCDBD|nr:ABC transporter substrate-binding protein [Streptomyces sp. NBRC 109706]